jgi:hypothetical protein
MMYNRRDCSTLVVASSNVSTDTGLKLDSSKEQRRANSLTEPDAR